jgi:hypothetical protein
MNEITPQLKETFKDILSEESLKEIQSAFDAAVGNKVKLHVEKALMEQDEDYSNRLSKLLEAIDSDHTIKLNKVYKAICENHAQKLKNIVERYEAAAGSDAVGFKNNLVENISNYLELYIDEAIPAEAINEAVKNRRAAEVLQNMKKDLAVDEALAKDSIRDAVVDGKKQIDEASKKLEAVVSENTALKTKLTEIEHKKFIATKTGSMDPAKAEKVLKLLANNDLEFIKENFDYAVKMFEKSEEERLETLATEAADETTTNEVDRPVIEEKTEMMPSTEGDPAGNLYLRELSKY